MESLDLEIVIEILFQLDSPKDFVRFMSISKRMLSLKPHLDPFLLVLAERRVAQMFRDGSVDKTLLRTIRDRSYYAGPAPLHYLLYGRHEPNFFWYTGEEAASKDVVWKIHFRVGSVHLNLDLERGFKEFVVAKRSGDSMVCDNGSNIPSIFKRTYDNECWIGEESYRQMGFRCSSRPSVPIVESRVIISPPTESN